MGDSFLIRSTKKFFVIVYLLARVCAPRRMRPGVRVCVHVRERGVTFVQHYVGVVFMHPCCKKDTLVEMLQNYNTFL